MGTPRGLLLRSRVQEPDTTQLNLSVRQLQLLHDWQVTKSRALCTQHLRWYTPGP